MQAKSTVFIAYYRVSTDKQGKSGLGLEAQRAAVAHYLGSVGGTLLAEFYEIVQHWEKQHRAKASSHQALVAAKQRRAIRIEEPFATVIFCTSDPEIADAKTRSKWSRVLRYARKTKPAEQRLTDFIKSKGGLNQCAARFARITR